MFNIGSMKTALFGQIGFRNSEDPSYKNLQSTLTASATGMYWEDYHPLITIENLHAICPNYDAYNIDDWASGSTYSEGDLAKLSGIVYESLADSNINHSPSTTLGTWWKLPVNDWLTSKINASISKVLNRVFTSKKIQESTKTLIENVQLFDGAGRFQDVITPASRFVGLEITPKRINNIAITVDYIGLQFSQIQTALTIYVFHSGNPTAIKTQAITTAASNRFHWTAVSSIILNYVDYTNHRDSGGNYYIGYFEDDISGNAIKKRHQFADPPCGGCNTIDLGLYNLWNEFFDVRPVEVASGDLNGISLWDLSKTGYSLATNYGMNLSVSVNTDVTDILVSNKAIFTDALGYQFAYDMLQEMINQPQARLNRLGDNAQARAAFAITELNENDTLRKRLEDAMRGLSFDLSEISQALPRSGKKGLKFGAI